MRFSNSFWKVPPVLLATATLILIAGLAGAIFDAKNPIIPDQPKYTGSGGYVNGEDSDFGAGVWFDCADDENDFTIGCYTDHPDLIIVGTKTVKVDQKVNGNGAYGYMDVVEMGGIVENAQAKLVCDKVKMISFSNDDSDKIKSRCILVRCSIPSGTTLSLTLDQIESALACIDDSEVDGSLGKSVSTLTLDNNDLLRGNITSQGLRGEQ